MSGTPGESTPEESHTDVHLHPNRSIPHRFNTASCWLFGNFPILTYGITGQAVYLFLIKKAIIAHRAGGRETNPVLTRISWITSMILGAVMMPLFIVLFLTGVRWTYGGGSWSEQGCYATFTSPELAAVALLMSCSIPLNVALLYLFVMPLYDAAEFAKTASAQAAAKLLNTARKNIALAAVAACSQTLTMIFVLVTTVDPPPPGPVTSLVAVQYIAFGLLGFDPAISVVCCLLMTNVWSAGSVVDVAKVWKSKTTSVEYRASSRAGKPTSPQPSNASPNRISVLDKLRPLAPFGWQSSHAVGSAVESTHSVQEVSVAVSPLSPSSP